MTVQRITLKSKEDVAHWTNFFTVTEHCLRLALQQVGATVPAVREYFAHAQASAALNAPPKKAAQKKRARSPA